MRTITFFLFISLCPMLLGAQLPATDSLSRSDADFFLKKAKSQRTVGYVLLGGGGMLFLVGTASLGKAFTGNGSSATNQASFGAIAMVLGVIAPLASIPVFVSAGSNRKKGEELLRVHTRLQYLPILDQYQPVAGVQVPLGTRKTKNVVIP